MTSNHFDDLARALATRISRRQTLGVLAASVLGSVFGLGNTGIPVQAVDKVRIESTAPLLERAAKYAICKKLAMKPNSCGSAADKGDPLWNKVKACLYPTDSHKPKCPNCGKEPCQRKTSKEKWILEPGSGTNNYTFVAGQRITGIECPKIWQSGAPDYWTFAWKQAQRVLSKGTRIGMAINSREARTDCQFHIHLSCINPNVLKALENAKIPFSSFNGTWMPTKSVPLPVFDVKTGKYRGCRNFRVIHVKNYSNSAKNHNVFYHLYHNVVKHKNQMQYQTLVMVRRSTKDFYIINGVDNDHAGTLKPSTGAGEQLLDETCQQGLHPKFYKCQ